METHSPLRIGILSCAHMHVASYVHNFKSRDDAAVIGIYDEVGDRGRDFASQNGFGFFEDIDELLDQVDAVVVTSENHKHLALVQKAAAKGKHILCEKPVVAREDDATKLLDAVAESGVVFMTAFPCRFSPAFQRLKKRVESGEIGQVRAISATNRGRCPFGWFVETELSGGGAMIDHVVHVTDLLRSLLGEEITRVQAQTGSNVYGQKWEDTAMLTLEFESGIFATLDSSWSRPNSFKTWGDVTMTVLGEKGVIELDMFGQGLDVYKKEAGLASHGYGTDLDGEMVNAFLHAVKTDTVPPVTAFDGVQAARVALAGYRSVVAGQPVAVAV